jgi:hypothetical protein
MPDIIRLLVSDETTSAIFPISRGNEHVVQQETTSIAVFQRLPRLPFLALSDLRLPPESHLLIYLLPMSQRHVSYRKRNSPFSQWTGLPSLPPSRDNTAHERGSATDIFIP